MSGSRPPPEGHRAPSEASNRCHHYRKRMQSSDPQPALERALDCYKWTTSACLAPRPAKMAAHGGERHYRGAGHLRQLSLPRFSPAPESPGHEEQSRSRSLSRVFPYFRSMSEPCTEGDPGGGRRSSSVSSFIMAVSRRISRVLRDETETGAGESGRRENSDI